VIIDTRGRQSRAGLVAAVNGTPLHFASAIEARAIEWPFGIDLDPWGLNLAAGRLPWGGAQARAAKGT